MKKRKIARVGVAIIAAAVALIAVYFIFVGRNRPAPIPVKETLYDGVTYQRVVKYFPNAMIAHMIKIDTKTKGIQFLVTPADSKSETPLNARTTSQFLDEFGLQIAINGDGFTPWWSRGPADYYPHVGDPVAPLGFTASNGDDYWKGIELDEGERPVLYISRRDVFSFNDKPNRIYSAISGDRMIVLQGQPVAGLNDSELDPRTAIGLNKNGRYVYLIVVDGRQPFYSAGITFADLAQVLIDHDIYIAMSLDGGGSSTLVMEGENGEPVILNSPIDNYIPGRERPVANHIGVYAP
ncbi:MAG TPA: phosphodiester glycosidase family protein [Anaerolineales bacterium]|nr:phosphodiester glycosidase family protein [Anaerolineales bacterium]HMS00065.1 phosphodiester glycosidase family protein [Anaerolineales bacterium]HNQ93730.1 phosphodiester glycosidase family protein [Anaerolineales bacterium]HNS59939.1 phosphodiester glycosidase family protein [Anaerolineales bacterium]